MATYSLKQKSRPHLFEAIDRTNQTMILRDGRRLGYAEHGDPVGTPVFFFHGSAGSRLEHPADVCATGIRIISTDRPGHGLSDFQPGRKLIDWPDDVAQLAAHLGIDKFYILGWSAGGPHALACAYSLPERVAAVALAASPAPMSWSGASKVLPRSNQIYIFAGRHLPFLVGLFRKIARSVIVGDADRARNQLAMSIPEVDEDAVHSGGNLEMWYQDVREGYR